MQPYPCALAAVAEGVGSIYGYLAVPYYRGNADLETFTTYCLMALLSRHVKSCSDQFVTLPELPPNLSCTCNILSWSSKQQLRTLFTAMTH